MIRILFLLCTLAWPVTRTHQDLINLAGRKGDIAHLYDLYNRAPSISVKEYGATGDGSTSDRAAIVAAYAAVPTGACLFFPPGTYRIDSTVTFNRAFVCLAGVGPASRIYPDVGATRDGLVFGTSINSILVRDLAVLANANVRDNIVVTLVWRSRFDNVHVRGAGRYEVYIRGALCNSFNFISSNNITYPNPAPAEVADSGIVRLGPKIGAVGDSIANNDNTFSHCLLEGGSFTPGISAQFYQEDQSGEGNNFLIGGTYEGASQGRAVEIYGSAHGQLSSLHLESSGDVLLSGCRAWAMGPGLRAEDVTVMSSRGVSFQGAQLENLYIGRNTQQTALLSVSFNGGGVYDSSTSTSQAGGMSDESNRFKRAQVTSAPSEGRNLLWNGDFRRFAGSVPDGFSTAGGSATYTQTGLGLADTRRKINPYAVKVVSDANTGPRWGYAMAGEDDRPALHNYWVTASAWAYIDSGVGTLTLRASMDAGASVPASQSTTTTGEWRKLQICFWADTAYSTATLELIATSGGRFYTSAWSMVPGFGSALLTAPHPANPGPYQYLGGKKQGYGSAAPASGNWIIGDIIWNSSVTAGGYAGWICTTAGSPGTWKQFGAVVP